MHGKENKKDDKPNLKNQKSEYKREDCRTCYIDKHFMLVTVYSTLAQVIQQDSKENHTK